MRLIWATDIHLDSAPPHKTLEFERMLSESEADAVILSGDIATAPTVTKALLLLRSAANMPIYFVLGNHDFYLGSVSDVRKSIQKLSSELDIVWLGGADPIPLNDRTTLIGHDGWADARAGSYWESHVELNDFYYIRELTGLRKGDRMDVMRELADESCEQIKNGLAACKGAQKVIIVTHVPPFEEASQHEGRMSGPDFLPFFCNKKLGKTLLDHAESRADQHIIVLCGHTHSAANYSPLPNLEVRAGAAEYGEPVVQSMLEI